jgi:predicted chitinase
MLDPERAAEPIFAVRSTIVFWLAHGLPELADLGRTGSAVEQITIRVNGDASTRSERLEKAVQIRDDGQFDGICRFSVAQPRFEDAQ